jgi:hypothetical protein
MEDTTLYATTNLPGSQFFQVFGPTTKQACEQWLNEQKSVYQHRYGGAWVSAYFPNRITTNKAARRWRYRDGSPVIRTDAEY